MAGALALLLGFGLLAPPSHTGPAEDAELSQCREWIQSHSQTPAPQTALTRILSPRTMCFDGQIYRSTLKEAVAWADRAAIGRAVRPRLVVRSTGGDADAAMDLAEKL